MKKQKNNQIENLTNTEEILEELTNTRNPLKFLWKTINLKTCINIFFSYWIFTISDVVEGDNYKIISSEFYDVLYESWYQNLIYQGIKNYLKDSKYFDDKIWFEVYWNLQNKNFNDFFQQLASKLNKKTKYKKLTSNEILELKNAYPDYESFVSTYLENKTLFSPKYNSRWVFDYIDFLHKFYKNFWYENFIQRLENNISPFKENQLSKKQNFSLLISLVWKIISQYFPEISDDKYWYIKEEIQSYKDWNKKFFKRRLEKKFGLKEIEESKGYQKIKTRLIEEVYPEILNLSSFFSKNFVSNKSKFQEYKMNISDQISYLKKINLIKEFIIKFKKTPLSWLIEPVFIIKLSKQLWMDLSDSRKELSKRYKIKSIMLFGLSKNYEEYCQIYDFLTKLELILKGDKKIKLKLITGYCFICFIFLFFSFFFLPFWITFLIILGILHLLRKFFNEIKQHTEYKIKFNFWINILFTLSVPVILGTSIFVTESDAYKSGYKNFKEIINILSANTFADILESWKKNLNADINDKEKWNNYFECKINRNYLENKKSCYSETVKSQVKNVENKNDLIQQVDSKKLKKQSLFYKNQEIKVWNWFMLRNAVDKILTKYEIENKINFKNKNQRDKFVQKVSKSYIKINLDIFRKKSLNKKSNEMYRNELAKWLPVWFMLDLEEIEKIIVSLSKKI